MAGWIEVARILVGFVVVVKSPYLGTWEFSTEFKADRGDISEKHSHTFIIIIAPSGMIYPLYTSSLVTQCGTAAVRVVGIPTVLVNDRTETKKDGCTAERLLDNPTNIREVFSILPFGHSIKSNHFVNLELSFLLHFWVKNHSLSCVVSRGKLTLGQWKGLYTFTNPSAVFHWVSLTVRQHQVFSIY
jgi:hypothetical protein